MRKLVITLSLVMALAIAAAVSLPVLAVDLGTTTLSVTIPEGVIEVTPPADATMSPATPTTPGNTSPLTVTVSSNGNWSLTAKDARTSFAAWQSKGHMDNASLSIKLINPTEVKGGLIAPWGNLETDQVLQTGNAGSSSVSDIVFQQRVEYTDKPGTYTIVVTFEGTALP